MRAVRWLAAGIAVAALAGCGGQAGSVVAGAPGARVEAVKGPAAATRLLAGAADAMSAAGTGRMHSNATLVGPAWRTRAVVDAVFDIDRDRWSGSLTTTPSGRGVDFPADGTTEMVGAKDRTFVRSHSVGAGQSWVGYRDPTAPTAAVAEISLLSALRQAIGLEVSEDAGMRTVRAMLPMEYAISLLDPDGIVVENYPKADLSQQVVGLAVQIDSAGRPVLISMPRTVVRSAGLSTGSRAEIATGDFSALISDLGEPIKVSVPRDVRMLSEDEAREAFAEPTGT